MRRCVLLVALLALSWAAPRPASACGGKGDCKVGGPKCDDGKWKKPDKCVKSPYAGPWMHYGVCDEYGWGSSGGGCGNVFRGELPLPIICGYPIVSHVCLGPPVNDCNCPNGVIPGSDLCR